MHDRRTATPGDTGGVLLTIVGVVLAAAIGLFAVAAMPTGQPPDAGRPVDRSVRTALEAARQRAVEWATPECRSRVREQVALARTERVVEDTAWAACPDHPDAYD
jgi:hypothetical protein